jgi:bis(5'-nucleosyl)-tetraphosphatase (symmetrical)
MDRLRYITNCFTRLRYCTSDGKLALHEKGSPTNKPAGVVPWFAIADRASRKDRIIFGHWSTLGYYHRNNVWAIDTGCLWGGQLTALKIKNNANPKPIKLSCPGVLKPGMR